MDGKGKPTMGDQSTYMDVPVFAAGLPMMMLSETPAMLSVLPRADASNKWSVVFSNEASIRTLSFIFATPNRVIPNTSPYKIHDVSSHLSIRRRVKTGLVRHDVSKKHNMPRVDAHTVTRHCVLNLIDDRPTGCLNTQYLGRLDDVVRRRMLSNNPYKDV